MAREAHSNYVDGVLEQARLRPDATAIDAPQGVLSFAALAGAMGGVATGLRARGLRPGDTVAVVCRDPCDYLVAALGTALGGFALLALDPTWPAGTLERLVDATGAAAVVGAGRSARDGPDDALRALDIADLPPADPWPVRDPGGERVCQIAVSSGTTGPAKAAPVSHRRLLTRTRAMTGPLGIDASHRYMPLVAMSLAIGRGPALRTLDVGGRVVIRPLTVPYEAHLAEIARLGITYLSVTPSHIHDYLEHLPADASPALPGVRALMVNSAALPMDVCADARARLTPNLHVTYGSNEMGYVAHAGPRELDAHPGTVGRVLPGIAVEVVDGAGAALPPGAVGELRIRTPHLAET
ncbi:MAG: class I adenylate-forming enzyme family protein [Alphaproteobacteria bacterium]